MQGPFRIVHSMGRSITGVEEVRRRWRWRARLRPAWRAGAAIWDLLPDQVRARFRRRRVAGASSSQP